MEFISGSNHAACAGDAATIQGLRNQLCRRNESLGETAEEDYTLNQTILDMRHTINSQDKEMVTLKDEHKKLTFFCSVITYVARSDAMRINERIVVWLSKGWGKKTAERTDAYFSHLQQVRYCILKTLYDNCPDLESSDWINYLCKGELHEPERIELAWYVCRSKMCTSDRLLRHSTISGRVTP